MYSIIFALTSSLTRKKRSCQVGGGMSHHCSAALLDSQMAMRDWLHSKFSPGKRTLTANINVETKSVTRIDGADNIKDIER